MISFESFTFVYERLKELLSTDDFKALLADEEEELKILQGWVDTAQNLLKDVDEVQRQANMNAELRAKVQQVMGILDEIEDVLDTFNQTEQVQQIDRGWVGGTVSLIIDKGKSVKRKRSNVNWAKDITERLESLVHCLKDDHQLSSKCPQLPRRMRLQTQPEIIGEEFIVRLEEDIQAYLAQLVPGEANLSKDLAIFGMGGAGKTTTARMLYNHEQISEHFDRSAWVCVSQVWDKNQLLLQICRQVGVPFSADDVEKLVIDLKAFLLNWSCFFVLDDVWEIKALLEILPILRSANGRGRTSKVLVTTRNEDIFTSSQHDFSIRQIRLLTQEESRDLFVKTLRRNNSEDSEWYLEGEFVELGKEMLQKCRGLPLAIIALGGLLSSKTTRHEWETIKNDVAARIMRHKGGEDDYGVVREIIELSYFDLPYRLKPCFLYLGIFPEDSIIDAKELIGLWIAEGFIEADQSSVWNSLEEIAASFLHELGHRCLVEISANDYLQSGIHCGDIVSIQIHDLIRDFCMTQRSKDSKRLIIHNHRSTSYVKNLRTRSYVWFGGGQRDRLDLQFEQMKFLRVLYLKGNFNLSVPIGDLILLRHLQVGRDCRVSQECLDSIPKLRNLFTFIFPRTECALVIPDNMVGKMENLRHLILPNFSVRFGGERLGVGNKSELQVLRAPSGEWVTKELPQVSIGLKELQLTDICTEAELEAIYEFVSSQCGLLHTLHLSLPPYLTLAFNLQKLKSRRCASLNLDGKIRDDQLEFPPRLLYLTLSLSFIREEEQLKGALAQLHELRSLCLHLHSYKADRLSMSGLPKLRVLKLVDLYDVKEWRIENGALLNLRSLEIRACGGLERLPTQIRHIHSLQHLKASGMKTTFDQRLKSPSEHGDGEGEDFHLISHISSRQSSVLNLY